MILQFSYDASTAQAPDGFVQDLQQIASFLDAAIPQTATITIRVGWGEINGNPITSLGHSGTTEQMMTYQQLQGAIPSLPAIDPHPYTQYYIPGAQAVLLGLAPGTVDEGAIGFSSSAHYNFDHSATAGTSDFIGVALHEITEVLGRQDLLDGFVNAVTEYDVYRDGSIPNAFFSFNGHSHINQFSNMDGTDSGDWTPHEDDAFTAVTTLGHELHFSEGDQLVIDSLYGIHRTPEVFANQSGTIAVVVEDAMYGVVGTQHEVETLVNFLPGQLAFANANGFNSNVYGAQVVAEALAMGNETGSHAWGQTYGTTAFANTLDGDHAFAALVTSNVFGPSALDGHTTDVIATWTANWKTFFTANHLMSTPDQIDMAARASAFGDAIGVVIDNNLNGTHDLATNFIGLASHGTGVYGASLHMQAEYNPLLMI